MSQIEIVDHTLRAQLLGADVVRARLRTLTIPLTAIRAVSVGIPALALKEPAVFWGSYDAGEMIVGNAEAHDGHRASFFEVRDPARAVTLELARGHFEYVVLEPSNTDPGALVDAIREALGHPLPSADVPPDLLDDTRPTTPFTPRRTP